MQHFQLSLESRAKKSNRRGQRVAAKQKCLQRKSHMHLRETNRWVVRKVVEAH